MSGHSTVMMSSEHLVFWGFFGTIVLPVIWLAAKGVVTAIAEGFFTKTVQEPREVAEDKGVTVEQMLEVLNGNTFGATFGEGRAIDAANIDLCQFIKDIEEEIHDSTNLKSHEFDIIAGVQKEYSDSTADFAPGSEPRGDMEFFGKSQPPSDDAFFGNSGELWVGSGNCCDGPGSPMDVFGEGRVSPILGWVSVVIVTVVAGVAFATLWPRIFTFFR
jgi:hypothetical protein